MASVTLNEAPMSQILPFYTSCNRPVHAVGFLPHL